MVVGKFRGVECMAETCIRVALRKLYHIPVGFIFEVNSALYYTCTRWLLLWQSFTTHSPIIRLYLGAEQLIKHLSSAGIPIAICTGSSAHTYDCKISKRRALFSLFSHTVCSDDPEVTHGKPAPDIYEVTARRFKNPPQSPANVRL